MHGNNKTGTTQQNHNTKYNVVHPQCRGYVHKLCFIPLSSKPQFIYALSYRFLLPFDSRAHSSRLLRTQLQRSSTHTAGTCSFPTKSNLTSPYLSYIKSLTYPFSISAYLYCAAYKNHGLKPWAPTKTLTQDLTHGFITKREGFDLP